MSDLFDRLAFEQLASDDYIFRDRRVRILDPVYQLFHRGPAKFIRVLLPGGELRIQYLREVDARSEEHTSELQSRI